MRNGNELLLGEDDGWLEVFDISSSTITNSCCVIKSDKISEIVAVDDTHFLLATGIGLFKTTKDQMLAHYFKWELITSLFHISDSIYLVGLN